MIDSSYNMNSSRIKTTNVTTIRPQNAYQKVENGRVYGVGSQVSGVNEAVSSGYNNNVKINMSNNTINTNNSTTNPSQYTFKTPIFNKAIQDPTK